MDWTRACSPACKTIGKPDQLLLKPRLGPDWDKAMHTSRCRCEQIP